MSVQAFIVSVVAVAACVWQDGIHDCPDGARYTSGIAQPYPFHRRFCAWPKQLLTVVSLSSLVMLGTLMGDWKRALLLVSLPGFWLVATRPTAVDAPAMLLAYGAALLFPAQPYLAVGVSCFSAIIHERGPVFAALYAWHPLLLVGLVCVGWWRKAAPADSDMRVGRGFLWSLGVHRGDNDWLNWSTSLFALRGIPLLAAGYGCSLGAWVTLGVAWMSRIVGSDFGRYVFWAAPMMVRDLPDVPAWMVMLHALTFRRMT